MPITKRKAHFVCLRCGHGYQDEYSPQEIRERSCPRCASNSVRRVRKPAPSSRASPDGED